MGLFGTIEVHKVREVEGQFAELLALAVGLRRKLMDAITKYKHSTNTILSISQNTFSE
jgi:hypothetical protein